MDEMIKEIRKAARLAPNLPEELERQRELRRLETRRDDAWRSYDQASKEIDQMKEELLDKISKRLKQTTEDELLFVL